VIYGFFFVGGQVYVDMKARPEMRAQAQGLISLLLFGVGMLIGTFVSGKLIEVYTVERITNWNAVWLIITAITAISLAAFWLAFRDDVIKRVAPAAEAPGLAGAEAAKA
jgi:MFS family permease